MSVGTRSTRPQRIFSRSAIIERLWSLDGSPAESAVTVHIKELRQKLKTGGMTEEIMEITGITPIGRATCNRLDLNDERHNEGSIVKARRLWMRGGWHPPNEDPRQG